MVAGNVSFTPKIVDDFRGIEGQQAFRVIHLRVLQRIMEIGAGTLGRQSSTGSTVTGRIGPDAKIPGIGREILQQAEVKEAVRRAEMAD
ncbi:MAG: hypothetical protein ABI165_06005 [Bryobacteraceae bacterium]